MKKTTKKAVFFDQTHKKLKICCPVPDLVINPFLLCQQARHHMGMLSESVSFSIPIPKKKKILNIGSNRISTKTFQFEPCYANLI